MSRNIAFSHDLCRSKMCLICRKKFKPKCLTNIVPNSKILERVREFYHPSYDPNDQYLPSAICSIDRQLLLDVKNGKKDRNSVPNFQAMPRTQFPTGTFSTLTDCLCPICRIVRERVDEGHTVSCKSSITPNPRGRPPKPPIQLCPTCLSDENPHLNCSEAKKGQNVSKHLDSKSKEQIATDVIKEKIASTSSDTIQLRTGGKPFRMPKPVRRGLSKAKYAGKAKIPAKEYRKAITAIGMSANQGNLFANALRTWKGNNFFEARLCNKMSKLDRDMDSYYTVEDIPINTSNKEELLDEFGFVTRPLFYTDKLEQLIEHKVSEMKLPPGSKYFVRVGIDKGSRWLKVGFNIVPICASPRYQRRRSNFKDGTLPKRLKETGVKKWIPIAFLQDATESYHNIEQIILKTGLNSVKYSLAMDMKLALTLLGLGTAASSHPCFFCDLHKDLFKALEHILKGGKLRSFAAIEAYAKEYAAAVEAHTGAKKLSSKEFKNCEHKSLFDLEELDENSLVVHYVAPMALHILLGLGNKAYKELEEVLVNLGFKLTLQNWLRPLGLKQSERHSGQFNGNQMVSVLKSVNRLRMLLGKSRALQIVEPILAAMEALDSVRESCFSNTLDPDFKDEIRRLSELWLEAELTVTPKAHVLFAHVAQFLDFQNKDRAEGDKLGLAYWSEQTTESAHHDFDKHWTQGCYKREIGHVDYKRMTLKCISTYASRHL